VSHHGRATEGVLLQVRKCIANRTGASEGDMQCLDNATLSPAVEEAHEGQDNLLPADEIAMKIIAGIRQREFTTLGCPVTCVPYTLTGGCRCSHSL
jgi:hypothetical protein